MGPNRLLTRFLDDCLTYRDNSQWRSRHYSRLLHRASTRNTYAETVKKTGKLPDPDSLHRRIAIARPEDLRQAFHRLTKRCLKRLNRRRGVLVMVDLQLEPFYGHTANPYIHPYCEEKGATGSFQYMTAHVLVDGEDRFFIDALPVHRLQSKAELLEQVLRSVKALGVKARAVLLDRGFASSAVIALLEKLRLRYLVHFPRNRRVKTVMAEMGPQRYWQGRFTVKDAETTLMVIRREEGDWVFATNMGFAEAAAPIRLYKLRWNIETGHRCKGEAKVKTKSLLVAVRYFLFLVALVLYNLWKLLPARPPLKRLLAELDELEAAEAAKEEGEAGVKLRVLDLPLRDL